MFSKLMATSLMEKVSRFQSFRVSGLSTEAFFEHRSFSEGVGEGGVSEFQSFRVSGLPTEAFFEHRSFSEGVGEGGVSEFGFAELAFGSVQG